MSDRDINIIVILSLLIIVVAPIISFEKMWPGSSKAGGFSTIETKAYNKQNKIDVITNKISDIEDNK